MNFIKTKNNDATRMWRELYAEAGKAALSEPFLSTLLGRMILECQSLEVSLARILAYKMANELVSEKTLVQNFLNTFDVDGRHVVKSAVMDLTACLDRNPGSNIFSLYMYQRGFHALQSHRLAHHYWSIGRKELAILLQHRTAEVMSIDIHPSARIGESTFVGAGAGVVIGEHVCIGKNVSILHGVTLGGIDEKSDAGYPEVADGVWIGSNVKIYGNVKVGEGARLAAGSVVLKDIPPSCNAEGSSTKLVRPAVLSRAKQLNSSSTILSNARSSSASRMTGKSRTSASQDVGA